jgi:hypothetical protein
MYKLLCYAGLLGMLISFSCSKHIRYNSPLGGSWEARKSIGGLAGTISYPPGTGTRLYFNDSNEFTQVTGNTTSSGTYQLSPSATPGDYLLQFSYLVNGNLNQQIDSVRLAGNQLIFLPAQSCCDFPATCYERID